MQSILTVTTAAEDATLLTMDELRQATGVASGSDAKLTALGRSVASAIAARCNVEASGAVAPTLRLETLSRQFRLDCPVEHLILRRRPVVEIVSVIEDGVTLDADDYELNPALGTLLRLCNDYPAWWARAKIVVAFRAGWATVPENLRNAAMKLAAVLWSEGAKADPSLRRESIPGVIDREWWVGPSDDPLFTREIDELLAEYINPAIG